MSDGFRFYTNVSRKGNNLLVREISETGHSNYKVKFKPTLYTKSNKEEKFKSIYGDDAAPVHFDSMYDAKEWTSKYEDVRGFKVYGLTDYIRQYLYYNKPSNPVYSKLSIWCIDIETEVNDGFPSARLVDEPILVIALRDMQNKRVFSFGTKEYHGKDTKYLRCKDEKDLLKQFILFWEFIHIDIITGWNIEQFDLPYIIRRANRILGEEFTSSLSPWKLLSCEVEEFSETDYRFKTKISGVSVLDYMLLYKKYKTGVKQESYSLGNISQVELGVTKVDHSDLSWQEFYSDANWDKFVYYNAVDTLRVDQLEDKLHFIQLVTSVAYDARVNFEDVASPVKTWDSIIHNYCLDRNMVLPQVSREHMKTLEGAFVKEPKPGRYYNISYLDATSLYPSIIITNNISPETYVGNTPVQFKDFIDGTESFEGRENVVTPVGAMYSKKKRGIFPELVIHYMAERKNVKTKMLDKEKELEKIQAELRRRGAI